MKMTKDKLKGLLSISLFVQAICMIIVSLTQFKRRKGLAFSFLGIGAVCAALAAAFGRFEYADRDEDEAIEASDDDDFEIDGDLLRADLAHGTDDEED